MRVAVHYQDDHPQHPGAVFAYLLGRIEDGVHNVAAGHDPVPIDAYVSRLIERARAEFPDALDVRLERLIDNGDGTSRWIAATEYDPSRHRALAGGETVARALEVSAAPAAQAAEPSAAPAPPTQDQVS